MTTPRRTVREPVDTEIYVEDDMPSRIAWGAVFAGALIALMTVILINLLLLGFGLSSINPAEEQNSLAALGTGAAIGLIVSNLIALFIGGWVAGRLANKPRSTESILHGLLTWGVLTIASFFLISSAVGRLVSGITSAVGTGLTAISQGVDAIAPEAAAAVEEALNLQNTTLQDIQQEAQQLLEQVDDNSQLQEGEVAQETTETAQDTATDIAQNPLQAGEEISELLTQLFAEGETADLAESATRQDLVEALVNRTDMSQAEAEETVSNWIQLYQQAQQALVQAQEALAEAAQTAAEALSTAAFWALIGLLVGAIVAALGSRIGSPKNLAEARAV